MPEVIWRGSYLKPFEFMEARHKRSNSDPVQKKVKKNKLNTIFEASNRHKEMEQIKGRDEGKTNQTSKTEVHNSLKQEILHLQERLHDQFVVRRALEKALSHKPFTYDVEIENLVPKAAKELIKEIAVLELEVAYLEKYLLSLYRKNYDKRFSPLTTIDENVRSTSLAHKELFPEAQAHDMIMSENENLATDPVSSRNSIGILPKECNESWGTERLLDSSIFRSHSSLSQRSAYSVSSPQKNVARAVDLYHSLPLSMLEQAQMDTSNGFSLAEHLGADSISDHVLETPNWLSEEMIKTISAIYCEIADPPLINNDYLSSPISYSSPMDVISNSQQGQGDMWSPQCGKFSSFNSHFDNPFSIGEPKEFSGPYCTMVKVQWICRDSKKLQDIEHKLQYYRLLVYQLEEVDVRRMKHEEKLAFWINVHNALVMHAYLVYGIPKNNLKRLSLLLKAAYNVGGQTVSIDTIQSSILGCRLPRPGQWLRFLFPSKTKFKVGDARRAYAIESQEPLLHFALCSGSYSDPAVRIYTPKEVFQELEVAKEEYIQSNFSINKEQKIMLPKVMEYFAKDSDICSSGLLQMVEQFMPDSLRKNLLSNRKNGKNIEWISHNFAFRASRPPSPHQRSSQNQEEERTHPNGTCNGDEIPNSHQTLDDAVEDGCEGEDDSEKTEKLLNIRDAFEALESQLVALQNLQHQQQYEKEVALAEIDCSRRLLLDKLKEYQGKDLEVILEASAFASEKVQNNNDLLLPPYPSRIAQSFLLDNGYVSQLPSTYKSLPNGVPTGDPKKNLTVEEENSKQVESKNSRKGLGYILSSAVKTVLPVVGVIYILSLSNFVPNLRKGTPLKLLGMHQQRANEEKNSTVQCPPGKVMVMENGEARCLVKERIEVPFESIIAKPDVNYGCG
ncbi:hypothetical protein COLO4_17797 [Corchorus olitorius]|uniref:DUF547 domain-containing protein n=1 Tax=Corchorus olitorius TaxID=93759 RepID=A0A1R3JBI8_9ROSI|nr:hypothetical protein COLO4_17797 [Corchorus olitorius]